MSLRMATLFSSSSGNSTYIASENTQILIDAGLAGKNITEALKKIEADPAKLSAILVTHEHADHIKGVGIISRKYDIPVYANEPTWSAMESKLGNIDKKNRVIIGRDDFFIGDLTVCPIPLFHDAADPTGYSVCHKDKKVSVITDTGKVSSDMLKRAEGSQIVLLEANHDVMTLKCGRYPYELKRRILSTLGHLSNEASAEVAVKLAKAGTKGILLGHLSKENNVEELALKTVADELIAAGFCPGHNIALKIAEKYDVTGVFMI